MTEEVLLRAFDAYNRGAHELAYDLLVDLLATRPDDARVRWLMSCVLSSMERFEEAATMAERAIELTPDNANNHAAHAMACLRMGRMSEAEVSISRAIQIDPKSSLARLLYCQLAIKRQDDDALAAGLDPLMALEPDRAVSHAFRSGLLLRSGKTSEAEAAIRRALKLDPEFADAHVGLAHILVQQDSHDDAVKAAEAALRLNPAHRGAKEILKKAKYIQRWGRLDGLMSSLVCFRGITFPLLMIIVLYFFGESILIVSKVVFQEDLMELVFVSFGAFAIFIFIGVEDRIRRSKPDASRIFFDPDY